MWSLVSRRVAAVAGAGVALGINTEGIRGRGRLGWSDTSRDLPRRGSGSSSLAHKLTSHLRSVASYGSLAPGITPPPSLPAAGMMDFNPHSVSSITTTRRPRHSS
ncbi:hypothetical protein J6590_043470 [Homalodisca vitripennis]|nr:hypothetical protein J6590_043470 [Homalodisca vitripennis]